MTKTLKIILICVLVAIIIASAVIIAVKSITHFTVRFETNGGDELAPIENVLKGTSIPEPPNPVRTDYVFSGWFKDEACTKPWIFSQDTVKWDVTLYAKWTEGFSLGLSYQQNKDKTYSVSKGSAMDSEMIIPSKHNGANVTELASNGFLNLPSMKSIFIPNTVTKIGVSCFQLCTGLTVVNIPESVTHLDVNAFYDCRNLESVTLSNNIKNIESNTFYNCGKLMNVAMPDHLTGIGTYAFANCTSLQTLTLPAKLNTISAWAFSGCTALSNLTIESGVTSIGIQAFDGCKNLNTIIFRGTKAQWEQISKDSNWRGNCPVSTVSCDDGAIVL